MDAEFIKYVKGNNKFTITSKSYTLSVLVSIIIFILLGSIAVVSVVSLIMLCIVLLPFVVIYDIFRVIRRVLE